MVAGVIEPERGAFVFLDEAASRLLAAAWSDPADCSPGARLSCLSAADRLCAVGARASRTWAPPSADEVVGAVVVALVVLAVLADDAAAGDEAAQAQEALQALLSELV